MVLLVYSIMLNQSFKFKGGVWIGFASATWPWGILEFDRDQLTIAIADMKKLSFTRNEIERLEVKKYFPIVAYGIHIVPRDKTKGTPLYFWYISFRFNKLISALKDCGWL